MRKRQEVGRGLRLAVNQNDERMDENVIYDSQNERKFAAELEAHHKEVEVYVKLPRGFYISTPVGRYSPDWAIAFHEDKVKHIYFVAETKGDMSTLELRKIEETKAHCAHEHFRAISYDNAKYDIVDSYDKLWEMVSG
ncbi:MAG: type III restriction enzyme [Spirochaetes bacterium]|nr:MAG: type III restriction enzyme [Spirochaetota bacterium]